MNKLYAVIGKPILHSKSPQLMNAAFTMQKMDAHYTRIASNNIEDALHLVEALEIEGINCTAPYKSALVKYADVKSKNVEQLQAANTLLKSGAVWAAFNTDITGVWNSLKDQISKVEQANVLIIGAGGAASSAAMALHLNKISFTICNRTVAKASKLAEQFSAKVLSFDKLYDALDQFDIIISTIDSRLLESAKISLSKELILFDAIYKNSIWKEKLQHPGAELITGKAWLIHQGIEAFNHFTNLEASYTDWEKAFNYDHLKKQKIALIGFMGSGKSSVAKELSKISGWPNIDTDDWIEKKEDTSIASIFNNKGESVFRDLESQALTDMFESDYKIIATGGGIIKKEENRIMLKKNYLCIWLYIDTDTCMERVDGVHRPLLNIEDPRTAINDLLLERKTHYARCSDLVINTVNKSIQDIAILIYEEINQVGYS